MISRVEWYPPCTSVSLCVGTYLLWHSTNKSWVAPSCHWGLWDRGYEIPARFMIHKICYLFGVNTQQAVFCVFHGHPPSQIKFILSKLDISYNTISFLQNIHKKTKQNKTKTPQLTHEDNVWSVLCKFIIILIYIILHFLLACYMWYFISTHWGRDEMAAIFQTTFWNAFSRKKMYEFRLQFHWSLFLRFELTIFQHWFR